jgi:transposase
VRAFVARETNSLFVDRALGHTSPRVTTPSDKTPPITSALEPDLAAVETFLRETFVRGAITLLVAAVLGLLRRMRDLNLELMKRLTAASSRKRPPSEAMRRLQLEFPFLAAAPSNDKPARLPKEPKKRGAKTPTAHGRPNLPAHLPRVPEPHFVPDAERVCPSCDVALERVCMKTTAEKLDVVPAKYVVRQVQVETCACPRCRAHIVTAPTPDEVVDRGILGNDLLVDALVDHYADAVPFERMARNAREEGVPLAANTLAASVGALVDLFDPVVDHIRERSLSSTFTALDATSMRMLDPAHPLGIKTCALWLVEGDHRYACFLYAPSAHAAHIEKFFAGRTLASVMCDGSPTNNCVERDAKGRRGGCNAHGRRGLVAALRLGDARALEGLGLYAKIFAVDADSLRLGETLDMRAARRAIHSAPAVAALGAWVELRLLDVEPKSPLGKAVRYLHRQWPRLIAFLEDPLMELTNNEVERDLRPWVLDRKTWLFVGNERSARRAANALSIITTCKKMGVAPRAYLRFALAKLLAGEKKLEALLPETFAASLAETARANANAPTAMAA